MRLDFGDMIQLDQASAVDHRQTRDRKPMTLRILSLAKDREIYGFDLCIVKRCRFFVLWQGFGLMSRTSFSKRIVGMAFS